MKKASLLIICCACLAVAPEAHAGETVSDGWSSQIVWRDQHGNEANAEHVILMPDGQLILFGYQTGEFSMVPDPPTGPDQGSGEQDVFLFDNSALYPFPDNQPSCGGHTLLDDGRLFAVGGDDWTLGGGLKWAITFDGSGFALVDQPMIGVGENPLTGPVRWYPDVTRLADSRVLITGGIALWNPWEINRSVEIYNPYLNSWELVSEHDDSPSEIYNVDYTHAFQLPQDVGIHDVLMFGQAGYPVLLSTSSGSWNVVQDRRPQEAGESPTAPNHGTATLLLPLRVVNGEWGYANGTVLMAGGEHNLSYESHVDIFDPFADEWKSRIDMIVPRHHPSTVLLPDGRILVVAGHSHQATPEELGTAQYIDPADGFSMKFGQSSYTEVRGYHTVTVLLPDGHVLVGSGNPDGAAGQERTDFRYYRPDYMFASRPLIVDAPEVMDYGQPYEVSWADANSISEVVLIALGSMTHSVDMNQRYVQLEVTGSGANLTSFLAPPNSRVAPAGHYMLFVLDENRVPSVAEIVRIEPSDVDADDVIDLLDNCPEDANPRQEDADADAVGDACDNCVYAANPDQGAATLGQAILAQDPSTFVWSEPAEVVYARGELALVDTYTVDLVDSLPLGAELVEGSLPASGSGFFYVLKPDCPVGSWQTSPGSEPGRDIALP